MFEKVGMKTEKKQRLEEKDESPRVYSASFHLLQRLPAVAKGEGGYVPQKGQAEQNVGVILVLFISPVKLSPASPRISSSSKRFSITSP